MAVATAITVQSSSSTHRLLSGRRRLHLPCASPSAAVITKNCFITCKISTIHRIRCCSDSSSSSSRGFGSNDSKVKKKSSTSRKDSRKPPSQRSGSDLNQAPSLNPQNNVLKSTNSVTDIEFEEKLQAIKRSALEQKKVEEETKFGAIDYDAPVEPKSSNVGLGTKIGVGVAVVVFGLVFALGDFLPSVSVKPTKEVTAADKKISEEEKANLQKSLKQFEDALATNPEDPTALEGAAVTLAELGDYTRASSLLENLAKKKPNDPDVFRLLGEVKYELGDYEGSASAYKSSAMVSKTTDFEVLRGLTNALLAAKKPDEAVQMLLASREHLNEEKPSGGNDGSESSDTKSRSQVDPIQVDLLLGKAYSDWGHVSDAVAVYDQIISSHPEDFRGYLAKGIILKENGSVGDAERMFIQARFFAPKNAKAFIDKYSR
ncbi:PREDICTED: uncharacterized protein LOC109192338 [Ipomoea nil]|uniref:uncharacterized protein LOC109192338 n=1 Tax=Ipomoea nil TaxID=35883 RepID=UPI000901DCC8|nr:PREDICTED: uncharacterized protein LOC109192338 [Ipomoea nil]